ncbi:MAG: PorT family protein [Bacteroidetes bacterium]|nr:PorT family protein [Bacteroidota bacterium]MBU1579641.1 PorT family protein [Bacteroidota bacterium]MBU2556714.1 PorT family protein [Bacteroidota bacterium]
MSKFKHFLSFGIIVILFFNSLSKLNAQETASKLSVGAVFGGVYAYRNLEGSLDYIIEMRNEAESPAYGFTGGLNFGYHLTDNWLLESGIEYATRGYNSTAQGIDGEGNVLSSYKARNTYHFIDVPILASFSLSSIYVKPFISAGLAANIFVKEMHYLDLVNFSGKHDISNRRISSEKNALGLEGILAIGITFSVNEKLYSKFRMYYAHDLFKTTDTPITEKLYTIGVQAGLFYRF